MNMNDSVDLLSFRDCDMLFIVLIMIFASTHSVFAKCAGTKLTES